MKKYLTKGMKGIYNYATGKKPASGEEEKKQEESKDTQVEESKTTKVVTKQTPTCGQPKEQK